MAIQVDITTHDNRWDTHIWQGADSHVPIKTLIVRAVKITVKTTVKTPISAFDMGGCEVSVVLANDNFVRHLNCRYRGKDTPTNVLSFAARDGYMVGDMAKNLGDIVIAYETVMAQAQQGGISPMHHCVHLVVHGTLHLLGLDHETPEAAENMEDLETHILAKMGIGDPYANMDANTDVI